MSAPLLLFGFGPSIEFIRAVVIGSLFVLVLLLCLLLRRLRVIRTSLTTLLLIYPLAFFATWQTGCFIYKYCTTPMDVTAADLPGEYVIDRDLFKGPNADWQYDHYTIKVSDSFLYLRIMDGGKQIKEYTQPIKVAPIGNGFTHTFFTFHDDYFFDHNLYDSAYHATFTDSTKHHMLRFNPRLMSNPFSFRIILFSTRYGYMFFKKGRWKGR